MSFKTIIIIYLFDYLPSISCSYGGDKREYIKDEMNDWASESIIDTLEFTSVMALIIDPLRVGKAGSQWAIWHILL